jgi:alanine racemase
MRKEGIIKLDRQTFLEINTDNFKYNVEQIKKFANKDIMPIIKANGYGTYINKQLDLIKDFSIVGVAMAKEAIELRNIGFTNEIFILNQPFIQDIDNIIKYNITIGVCSKEFIHEIGAMGNPCKVPIELETGMGRTGIRLDQIDDIVNCIKQYPNIEVDGVYTHFAAADYDSEYTNKQIELFDEGANKLKSIFPSIKYIHSSASDGLLNFDDKVTNLVRPGIILYGYEPFENAFKELKLKPIATLKSRVAFVKEIKAGESVSYGRKFIADRDMKIATIAIGYADGFRRSLSNVGEVLVNGHRCKVTGTVCMDSFMCDVTDVDCKYGDEVIIFDNEKITLDEIAEKCNTINYEILSGISDRVPRVFI